MYRITAPHSRRALFGPQAKGDRVLFESPTAESLSEAVFQAVQARVDLRGARLDGVVLSCAYLRGARLRCSLHGAHFGAADLRDAELGDLTNANLSEANLTGATLESAEGANLSGADVSGVDLRRKVRGALLARASVKGTHVDHQDLWQADFTDCVGLDELVIAHAEYPVTAAHLEQMVGIHRRNWEAILRARGELPTTGLRLRSMPGQINL